MASNNNVVADDVANRIDPALLRLGGVVVLGAVLSTLDATIVNVAIRELGVQLHAGLDTIQWVSAAYLLALSMVLPLTGWAVERFGAKTMWQFSLGVFLLGSLLCGVAWSAGSLIGFRVLQGVGGGMIMPIAQMVIASAAGPRRVGRVMALVAIPGMLAPVIGPVVGGLIVDSTSWRWIFLINLPIGAVAMLLAWRVLPTAAARPGTRLDILGVLLLSPGVAALAYGFSEAAGSGDFASPTALGGLVVGAVLFLAFVGHALRTRHQPLIDLRMFRHRNFSASMATSFFIGASLFGALILLPLYYQTGLGKSALVAGLLLAPQGLGVVLVAPLAGRLTDRYGAGWVVPIGMLLAVAGTVPYAFVDHEVPPLVLAAALLVRGAGLGATFMPAMVAAYQGLPRSATPHVTTAVNIAQRIGGSLGTALLVVMLQRRTAQEAVVPAFAWTFWITVGVTALAVVPSLWLPRSDARSAAPAGASETAPLAASTSD